MDDKVDVREFYDGKRVVVTGGSGMIGSILSEMLVEAGAKVFVLDDFSRGQNHVLDADHIVGGDATNLGNCEYAFRGAATRGKPVDAVFNLAAAVAGVLHNMSHQLEMFDANIKLQTVPLMAAESVGVPRFLQVSSVCVYSEMLNHPSREEYGDTFEPHQANYGYAWSKRMGEKLARVSGVEHVVIVRPSNVYGPRDYFRHRPHVIPALIRKAVEDEAINVYGQPQFTREFIYNRDVALGMMVALARGRNRREYNLGCNGNNVVSIRQLVTMVQEATGTEDKPIMWHTNRGGGDPMRWSDTSRAHRDLGWAWTVDLEDGLKETVEWFLTNQETTQ